jgi:hypothetical protein
MSGPGAVWDRFGTSRRSKDQFGTLTAAVRFHATCILIDPGPTTRLVHPRRVSIKAPTVPERRRGLFRVQVWISTAIGIGSGGHAHNFTEGIPKAPFFGYPQA